MGFLSGIGNLTLYFIVGFIGFLIGVILSCILLAKKNLAMEKKIEQNVEQGIDAAKERYKQIALEKSNAPLYLETILEEDDLELYEGKDLCEENTEISDD